MITKLRIKKEAEKIIKPLTKKLSFSELTILKGSVERLIEKVRKETINECILVGEDLKLKNKETKLFWNKFVKEMKC